MKNTMYQKRDTKAAKEAPFQLLICSQNEDN